MDRLDQAERYALVFVARLGPWLSPIPPAYFIARAAKNHLQAGQWIAVIMAVAVEAVGIATVHTALRAYTWNREKRQKDPAAPLWLGIVLSAAYLVIGILLAVFLEYDPVGLAPVAISAFFVLAGIAYLTLAMIADQARREAETAATKAQEKAEREEKRRNRPEPKAERAELIAGTVPERTTDTARTRAREIVTQNPAVPGAELGRQLGVSASLGRRLKRELSAEHSAHRNGTGEMQQ